MTFITFIYKVGNNNKTYYGKFCSDHISDDHEGLNTIVNNILQRGLNEYRKKNNQKLKLKSKIRIGILSFSSHDFIPTDSTEDEIKCFDFYCDYHGKIYINGNLV